MNFMKRGIFLVSAIIATLAGFKTKAQMPTTTVADTVYYADGTPAQGTIVLSWNAFTTANGAAIAAGNTTVTLGTGGALNIALAPNAGSTPMGNFYTAVYHLNDGETSREFWVVPSVIPGGGPAKLAGIRNEVLPTSVAMQTVTKQYVDAEIVAAEIAPVSLSSSPYLQKAGDTMTGPLVLPGDPTSALQAADKNYVDANVSAVCTSGTWTPVDASGASLTFTAVEGNYVKCGKQVTVWFRVIYPGTTNGAASLVGGLPFTSLSAGLSNPITGFTVYNSLGSAGMTEVGGGGGTVFTFLLSGNAQQTNANMSTGDVRGVLIYETN